VVTGEQFGGYFALELGVGVVGGIFNILLKKLFPLKITGKLWRVLGEG
jgi:hypothetical protein